MYIHFRRLAAVAALPLALTATLGAQQNRITARIDSSRTVVLRGHVHRQARQEFDQGRVQPSLQMPGILLHLKATSRQQTELRQLLSEQQDPASANYHKWLTPEEYADRFGLSRRDTEQAAAWLESQGFAVAGVARGRTWIRFNGTAEQVQNVFHTEVHRYQVKGEMHYANASDPAIPAALAEIVAGVHGLHDFHMKPRLVQGKFDAAAVGGGHALLPADFATIYDIAPLYKAGIDGTGQSIAVVGQTDVNLSDITRFRTQANLGVANFKKVLVPGQASPGISQNDLPEANLDIQWSGGVARNATIIYVYSNDVAVSLTHAIDQNMAPVISMSYGGCEEFDLVDLPAMQTTALQANAQGITWTAAAGDSGAADCDAGESPAQTGLGVDVPASLPEVTGIGGSEFMDSGGAYWTLGGGVNGGSATSYIPEQVWNDSTAAGSLSAGGGGASLIFLQPPWQVNAGVPNDGYRHVPDLSFSASAEHVPYFVYSGGAGNYFGGTSAGAPSMAGIVALLNQYLLSNGTLSKPGLGNINPALYRLAAGAPAAFHDITTGGNAVPCAANTPNCKNGVVGYSAGANYDLASGLGSPDVNALFQAWSSQPATRSVVIPTIDSNPVFQQSPDVNGNSWPFTITLTEAAGIGATLTGVTLNGKSFDPATTFGATNIPGHGSLTSKNLGLANVTVPTNVILIFSGSDAGGQPWTSQITVPFEGPQVQLVVAGASNTASGQQTYAPGMLVSVYGTAMGNFAQAAAELPLTYYMAGFEAWVNHVPAPLYFVSPKQVNIQIPYEIAPGRATLTVGNPYMNVDTPIQVSAAAPGIFTLNGAAAPFPGGARGGTYTIYITGEGQVVPALATGSNPTRATPKPAQAVTLTIGGVPADLPFMGIPNWAVGVTQINFQIPATAPLGVQPLIVTVGGVASPAANFTVTP